MPKVIMAVSAFSCGFLVAGGVIALIVGLGIITRLTGITHTAKENRWYESMIFLGAIVGNWLTIWKVPVPLGRMALLIMGLSFGIYTGGWIMALAEITEDECEWRIYIVSPEEEEYAALATILQLDYCDKNYRVTYRAVQTEYEPAGWGQPVPSEHLEKVNDPDGGPFLTWEAYNPEIYHSGS